MPRPRKPPRLWLQPPRRDRGGRVVQAGVWTILDRGSKKSTGCAPDDLDGARRALERHLAQSHRDEPLRRNVAAAEVLIVDVLRHYVEVRGRTVAQPGLLRIRIANLASFWGDKTLDEIDTRSCGRYVESRRPYVGGARRELEDLRTAVNLAKADKLCREEVVVTLPRKPKPRSDYLERDAVARLVWHAYRKRERQTISRGPRKGEIVETRKRPLRHLARFILFAIYTGTRSGRVWNAAFDKLPGHPWIDLERGIFYREAPGETAADNKRAPSIRIPKRLAAHLRRWRDGGHEPQAATTFLCEYRKGRPGDPKKAFARLVREVLKEEGSDIVRHSLRHTAATWLLQDSRNPHSIAGYLGMRTDTLITVYGHHHPDFQEEIGDSFTRGRAGRPRAE